MRTKLTMLIVILFIGCGPSDEEVSALATLEEVHEISSALIQNDITTLTELDAVIQKADEIKNEISKLDTLQRISETVCDSITAEYDTILYNLSELSTRGSDYIFQAYADSAYVYLEFVNTQCIACTSAAEECLGFSITREEPSAWSLRQVEIDNLLIVIELLDSLKTEISVFRSMIGRVEEYPVTENTMPYVMSVNNSLVEMSRRLTGLFITLNSFSIDARNAIDENRCNTLLGRTSSYEDIGTNIIWYRHVNSPRYTNSRSYICKLSLGVSPNGSVSSSWTVGYTRSDWVFLEKIQFNIDGNIITYEFDRYQEVDDFISGGDVSEWINISVYSNLDVLESIGNAESVVIIFSGRQRRYNREMSRSDITAIAEMLELYNLREYGIRLMGGQVEIN